jgi:hypothetical protein
MNTNKLVIVNNNVDTQEELRMLISQVHAQTLLISGEGLENFCSHNEHIKSNYLWSITDAAERALQLIDRAMSND